MPTSPDPPEDRSVDPSDEFDVFAETLAIGKNISGEDIPVPSSIGRFDVLRLLGTGAFGVVLLAKDESLSRNVAIKIPRGDRTEDEIEKFLFEARQMAQLQHPGIISVFDVGREGKLCYIVSEYLEGITLKERLCGEKLSYREAIEIVSRLAEAVGHAHSRGIMHRDIKPGNVMLTTDGRCVLLDFGLATNDLDAVRGEIAGTPTYMPPEQIRGESHRIDGRSDIYSLAVILYEILAGRPPFRAKTTDELFRRILSEPAQPVRQLNPAVPATLDEICVRALNKEMTDRFTTAGDFAAALKSTMGTSEVVDGESSLVLMDDSSGFQRSANLDATQSIAEASVESSQARKLRDAELRNVTLLRVGFEVSGQQMNVEDQHAMAEVFSSELVKIAESLGGHDSVLSGHEVGFCFGFPIAFEDATARAVRCGLRIMETLDKNAALPNRDQVFMAIHFGQAVAEETPQGVRTTGEVTQTLARLMPVIEPGEVIVTEPAQKACRIFFELESLGPVNVRGLSDPLTIYHVIKEKRDSLSRVELVDPGNLTPLIGRDTELSILKDRWEQTTEEMGQVVALIGEAGLGKSRLIREIREFVKSGEQESDIIELRCSQYHQSAGLYPAIEHLTQLLGFDETESAELRYLAISNYLESLGICNQENIFLLASMLGVVTDRPDPIDVSPQRKREMTGELLLQMLRRRAEKCPVLFIVEDLHWIDPSLLELLTLYVESFDQYRALSIFTFRPEFETPWHSKPHQTQIALNRLGKRQIRFMMQTCLGRKDLPESVIEQFLKRTDGNPLFIEEFSNLLIETNTLDDDSLAVESINRSIPDSLQDLLKARLDRMDSNPEVVQLAAAIGREFTFNLLLAASDLPSQTIQVELKKLCDAELLFQKGAIPDATFIFKHALIQDSAYDSLLKKRRQRIHAQIGDAIEAGLPEVVSQQPELLAHHYTQAGITDKAIDYWLKAGKRAQELSANVESIDHFERGLELVASLPDSPQRSATELGFQLSLAVSLMATYGYANPVVEEKLGRARELCDQIGPDAPQFPVLWANWAWCLVGERMAGARQFSNELLEIAERMGDAGAKAEAHLTSACTGTFEGEWELALQNSIESLRFFDLETSLGYMAFTGQNVGLMATQYKVLNSWFLGNFDQAYAAHEEGCRLTELVNHPFSTSCYRWHTGLFCVLARDSAQARCDMEIGLSIARQHSFPYWTGMNTMLQGAVLQLEDKADEAIEPLESGIAQVFATGAKNTVTIFMAFLANGLRKLGRDDEARQVLDKAFDQMETLGGGFSEVELLLAKAELERETSAARDVAQQAFDVSMKRKSPTFALRAAMLLADLGVDSASMIQSSCERIVGGRSSPDLLKAHEYLKSNI